MAKLRLIFTKEGRAAYISHLDLMRTFQRSFLRLGIVLRHSQGFHPHPIISFAMPLSVGQCSDCEILDFEVTQEMDGSDLPEKLNRYMPEGVKAIRCYVPEKPVRDLAYLHARVEFEYDNGIPAQAEEAIAQLFARQSVIIQKRTKRKDLADVDIRPMIKTINMTGEGSTLVLDAVVQAQNPGLNPALLSAAVEKHLPELAPDFVRVRRLEMLTAEGKSFI